MIKPIRALLFAGLAAIAATGSTSGTSDSDRHAPVYGAVSNPALSVMTYNVQGLPWPVAFRRDEALARIADRLAALRRHGGQPHIVLLQEAFIDGAARIARRAGYRHVAAGPDLTWRTPVAATPGDAAYLRAARWDRGEGMAKQLNSGLMILSDYPIVRVDRMAFPAVACAGFDCLANKGVLVAHLAVPGLARPVSVVNTHLNARKASGVANARSLRAFDRQAALLAAFVARHVPPDRMMILGGDLNIGRDPQRIDAFFQRSARAGLGFVAPALAGARQALARFDGPRVDDRDDLVRSTVRGKDWLFARDADGDPMPVRHAAVPFGSERGGAPLSDHFGYVIGFAPGGDARDAVRFAMARTARDAGAAR